MEVWESSEKLWNGICDRTLRETQYMFSVSLILTKDAVVNCVTGKSPFEHSLS